MTTSQAVATEIQQGNPWYVDEQFAWASRYGVRRIYRDRLRFFTACVRRAHHRRGPLLRLLDAGCGDGYWLWRLGQQPGLALEGVDYNPLRVARAARNAPHAQIHLADLNQLTEKKPYDVILSSQVIEHVEDDVGLLRRLRALLQPDGTLILGTTNEGSWLQQRRIRTLAGAFQTDHVHFYTEREIRRKLRDAGFGILRTLREPFYLPSDRLFYRLAGDPCGYRLLKFMTWLWRWECTDYYFECTYP